MDLAIKYGQEIVHPKLGKGAILGVSGLKRVLLDGYNQFIGGDLEPFESEEEAKDYLVS